MKASELRELSVEDLKAKLSSARNEVFQNRFQKSTGQSVKPSSVVSSRREVARIMTVLRQKGVQV